MGHKCSEFTPPALNVGPHMAPLGMKFYTGNNFPAEYKNNIFLAEHGGWNQFSHTGARIVRIQTDPDGKNISQEPFAWGWIKDNKYWAARPTWRSTRWMARSWSRMIRRARSIASGTTQAASNLPVGISILALATQDARASAFLSSGSTRTAPCESPPGSSWR
jgi:hypothetical protein